MADTIQLTDLGTTTDNTSAVTLAAADTLFVGMAATITTTGLLSPVVAGADDNQIVVEGTVYAARSEAVSLGNSSYVRVGSGGSIFAAYDSAPLGHAALSFTGTFNEVVNQGEIHGGHLGIQQQGDSLRLTNFGTITAASVVVDLDGGDAHIVNFGTISATSIGVPSYGIRIADSEQINIIVNSGTISSGWFAAISVEGGETRITNTGLIQHTGPGAAIDLGDGNDIVSTAKGIVIGTINGGGGDDFIVGSMSGDNALYGGDGDDTLRSFGGDDVLNGGSGSNILSGGTGDDIYVLENGSAEITDFGGVDLVTSTISRSIAAYATIEKLMLSDTDDINGYGNGLANTIFGNSGANIIHGAAGNDRLLGRAGDDTLNGSTGRDTLTGNEGRDTFVFNCALTAVNRDFITDFERVDTIQLENAIFKKVGSVGMLSAGAFKVGPKATQADDRIIYNKANGALYYDSDGSGSAAQVQFATVQNKFALNRTDFEII